MTLASVRTEMDARRHLTRIRLTAGIVRENMPKLQTLIDEARDCGDDRLLGYASWTAYVSDAFSDEPMRLPREERQQLVAMLAGEGMSTRAIAPIVGASHKTVARDIGAAPVSNDTPEAVPVSFADQIDRDAAQAAAMRVDPLTGEVTDIVTVVETSETVKTKTTTGLDGKNYKAQPPREPKPVATGHDAAIVNAEQGSKAFGLAIETLFGLDVTAERQRRIEDWALGNGACSPIVRDRVTPKNFRIIANALLVLATEWESENV